MEGPRAAKLLIVETFFVSTIGNMFPLLEIYFRYRKVFREGSFRLILVGTPEKVRHFRFREGSVLRRTARQSVSPLRSQVYGNQLAEFCTRVCRTFPTNH